MSGPRLATLRNETCCVVVLCECQSDIGEALGAEVYDSAGRGSETYGVRRSKLLQGHNSQSQAIGTEADFKLEVGTRRRGADGDGNGDEVERAQKIEAGGFSD